VADSPDGIVLRRDRDLQGRGNQIWIRRALVALLALIPILALFNLFGQHPETSKASTPAASLSVYAPTKLRGGLLFEARFHVTAHQELKNAILILDSGWAEGTTINTIEPSPTNEASKDGKLEFTLGHIPAGHSFILYLQFQVNPTNVGHRTAGVELWDGNSRLLHIPRAVTVYP
jgi:hypothetical protein